MYEQHWNLSTRPFENRIQADFFYPAETHQAALMKLRYAIENRRAAALLCGPCGMGKSLLVDAIANQLGDDFQPFCHLVFPQMDSDQLLSYIVEQTTSGTDASSHETAKNLSRFDSFIRKNIDDGRHAVIVIDESHLLEQNDLLEPLRLLLNVGASSAQGESAWTLVLAGQPMLLSQVERNHSLDERVAVKCMLNRFLPEESIAYIQHRLRQADADAESIFAYPAMERIHVLSEGIPRRINRLCDLALMVGFAEDRSIVDEDVINSVLGDFTAPRAA